MRAASSVALSRGSCSACERPWAMTMERPPTPTSTKRTLGARAASGSSAAASGPSWIMSQSTRDAERRAVATKNGSLCANGGPCVSWAEVAAVGGRRGAAVAAAACGWWALGGRRARIVAWRRRARRDGVGNPRGHRRTTSLLTRSARCDVARRGACGAAQRGAARRGAAQRCAAA